MTHAGAAPEALIARRFLLAAGAAVLLAPAIAQGDPLPTSAPKQFYVLFHSPGPRWDHAKEFAEQAGIQEHVAFLRGLFENGKLRMGGPFLDNSGGMAILEVASLDEARRIGESDSTVKNGLLKVTPKPWMAAFNRAD